MKRFLAIALCLLMIVGALASCKPSDGDVAADTTTPAETEPPVNNVDIDLGSYVFIRPESTSAALLASAVQLRKDLEAAAGTTIKMDVDWLKPGTEADDAAYEILVGNTNRKQTAAALEKAGEAGFVIQLDGNKLVIVGSNDTMTVAAMDYFTQTYLPTISGGKLSLPENLCYLSEQAKVLTVVEGGKSDFKIVYSDHLDNTTDDKGVVDYRVQLAKDVRANIEKISGVAPGLQTDWVKGDTDTSGYYEILIGDTNRPESLEAKQDLAINEYGVRVIGNKIVVAGWNEAAVGYAVDVLYDLLKRSVVVAADGSKSIKLVENTVTTSEKKEWVTDIPEYEGATLSGSVTCNHNQLEYYYTDTDESEFAAYRAKLEAAGFKLNCENTIAGNLFATYTNSRSFVHVYYVKSRNAVRIITGSNNSAPYLPENVNGQPEFTKITGSKITQMTLYYDSGNFGMCYIITLEDGSFIVFDGGGSTGNVDHIRLYNLLNKLNERPDGKIVVAAWILTHTHWDHFMGFYNLCLKYGTEIKVEQFIANEPDAVVYHNSGNPNLYMSNGSYDKAAAAVGGIKRVKPHTGMKFWVRNAEIEVLYTQEDLYPEILNTYNDSTMVLRMKLAGQSIMWLGDVQHAGSGVICEMYGDYIKSDIVQVAHHGATGGTKPLYTFISPDIALWPTDSATYAKQTASATASSSAYQVDYFVAKNLGVTDIFVACPNNVQLVMPYTPGSGKQIYIDVPAG